MQVCEGRRTLPGDGGVRADHASKHRRTTCFRGDARLPPLLNIKQADREINWTKEIINVSKIPNAKTWQGALACFCLIDFLTRAIATWRHTAWTGHDMCYMDTCTMVSMFSNLPPVHNVASCCSGDGRSLSVDVHIPQGHRGRVTHLYCSLQ